MIFGTVFGQSKTGLRFSFNPETDFFRFCCVFRYHCNLLMNGTKNGHGREGIERYPVVYGSDSWAILYVIFGKVNNMLLYVTFMLICACRMY